jgi:hypothetical protein
VFRVADPKPTTSLAVVSLTCSLLSWLVALLGTFPDYSRMGGGTAGIGSSFAMVLVAFLSATLCLIGVIAGIIALRRIRRGADRGRGKAWTGIALGCLPLVVLAGYFIWSIPAMWHALRNEIENRQKQKQGPI